MSPSLFYVTLCGTPTPPSVQASLQSMQVPSPLFCPISHVKHMLAQTDRMLYEGKALGSYIIAFQTQSLAGTESACSPFIHSFTKYLLIVLRVPGVLGTGETCTAHYHCSHGAYTLAHPGF